MKVILEIPIDAYLDCLSRFKSRTAEYVVLRNGITLTNEQGERVVQILTESERVATFLNMISDICPQFLDKVRQRPDEP